MIKILITLLIHTSCQNNSGEIPFPGKVPMLDPSNGDIFFGGDLVYGIDNRLDIYQVSNPFLLDRAASTVALINPQNLQTSGAVTRIQSPSFGTQYGLCSNEPFREQPAAAFCSGFLVSEDRIVTAGHCIRNQSECGNTRFVFGFSVQTSGQAIYEVPTDHVFSCAEVLHTVAESSGRDLAVIRLNRRVTHVLPLSVRRTGDVSVGDDLTVIGHPAGLPVKIAGDASVRSLRDSHLVANLDTYGGNSGSAVFNSETGEVEGILVRGDTDFVSQGGCRVSNRCTDDGCRGEDVTLIRHALSWIPVNPTPSPEPDPEPVPDPDPNPTPDGDIVFHSSSSQEIPDANSLGIENFINVPTNPAGRDVFVKVNIEHTYRGDLQIKLKSPDGRVVTLKSSNSRDGAAHVRETYGALKDFVSVANPGNWTLSVVDSLRLDTGRLVDWSIEFRSPQVATEFENRNRIAIPDNFPTGIESILNTAGAGTARSLSVSITIRHSYRGDLRIELLLPSGQIVRLKETNQQDSADDVIGEFGAALPQLQNVPRSGQYRLRVSDHFSRDIGELQSWKIKFNL